MIDQIATLVASSSLGDYHWWIRQHGWFPSPLSPLAISAIVVVATIKAQFWPDQSANARSAQRSSPPTYETVRGVADGDKNIDQTAPADEQDRRIAKLEEQVRALNASVNRLQEAGKKIITQREEWRTRALDSETKLRCNPPTVDERFDILRRMIARELHPDHCTGAEIEKVVRAEYFKRLWPEIERIAGQRGE